MCVDLHTHSVYSDGTQTPAEIIHLAKAANLSAVSLTDHDTVDGIEEFLHHGRAVGIKTISGLEISSTHRDFSLHILGYGIDHRLEGLHQELAKLQRGREERNLKIIAKLQKLGLDITSQELADYSGCGQAGRPHIAGLLLQKGVTKNLQSGFKDYLRKGAAAWAGRLIFSTSDAIAMIHLAGGLAVLAHPGHIDGAMKKQPLLIAELAEIGLDGLEVYYPGHTRKMQKKLKSLAVKHNLLVTGGSDYHGANKPKRKLAAPAGGFCPPDSIYPELRERLQAG